MKPFLKWAGNKYQIIHRIKAVLPEGNRLIEPFVGSGAVFLNTNYPDYLLSDINQDLINLYITVQVEGKDFIDYSRQLFTEENNTAFRYYELRDEFNKTVSIRRKSALFIYLNKHGYNGLCRYNSRGGFNVPFGRYKKPYFPEKELFFFCHKSQSAVFSCDDFVTTMEKGHFRDVLYCDPPYTPLSVTSSFTGYSSKGFGFEDQMKLAELAKRLVQERGVAVLISNHENDFVLRAYNSARIETFGVQRFISCNGANRNRVGEVLALFSEGTKSW